MIFPSTPHLYSNSRSNSTFTFLKSDQNIKPEPNSCSVIIQNGTHHSAILLPGNTGNNEVPATDFKPPHKKVNDVNSLLHTIFYSYYPDLSEPKPPNRRSSFKKTNIEIKNLQSCQLLNRPLPFPPYSPDTEQFLKKSKIQYSDFTDEDYLKHCANLVRYRNDVYDRNDVEK